MQGGFYDGTFIHRSIPGFVLQGGGYKLVNNDTFVHIGTLPAVAAEYSASRPNVRGSIAMARTAEPISTTSDWFFNLSDNSSALGPANSVGYTVFGVLTGPSQGVMEAISRLPISKGAAAFELPVIGEVTGGVVKAENLVLVRSAKVLPAAASDADRVFDYLEASYADFLKPPGTASAHGDAAGKRYYYRYYPNSRSYLGVGEADLGIYYLVPAVNEQINLLAPLAELLPTVRAAGY